MCRLLAQGGAEPQLATANFQPNQAARHEETSVIRLSVERAASQWLIVDVCFDLVETIMFTW